jgi:hypothetical protein
MLFQNFLINDLNEVFRTIPPRGSPRDRELIPGDDVYLNKQDISGISNIPANSLNWRWFLTREVRNGRGKERMKGMDDSSWVDVKRIHFQIRCQSFDHVSNSASSLKVEGLTPDSLMMLSSLTFRFCTSTGSASVVVVAASPSRQP